MALLILEGLDPYPPYLTRRASPPPNIRRASPDFEKAMRSTSTESDCGRRVPAGARRVRKRLPLSDRTQHDTYHSADARRRYRRHRVGVSPLETDTEQPCEDEEHQK